MPTLRSPLAAAVSSALAALIAFAMPALAQRATSPRPVRLAVPDDFPTPGARALIVRSPVASRGDVIILERSHATAEALSAALALLRELRRTVPDPPNVQVATMQGFTARGTIDRRSLDPLRAKLEQLRSTRPSRIGNLGMGRWIELGDGREERGR